MFSLMLLSVALGGCISEGGDSTDTIDDDMPVVEDFQGDYVECMTHEDLERCWNVFVPDTVDLSEDVPLVIDLHGNTLTMQMRSDLSQFDDIAEEKSSSVEGYDNSWNSGYGSTAGRWGLTTRS